MQSIRFSLLVGRRIGVLLLSVVLLAIAAPSAFGQDDCQHCFDAHRAAFDAAVAAQQLAYTTCHNAYLARHTGCEATYSAAHTACYTNSITCAQSAAGTAIVAGGACWPLVAGGPITGGIALATCLNGVAVALETALLVCIVARSGCQANALGARNACHTTNTATLNACYATADAARAAADVAMGIALRACLAACESQ